MAFACMGPAGRSAVTLAPADFWACAGSEDAAVSTSRARRTPEQHMRSRELKPRPCMERDAALKHRSSTLLHVFSFSGALSRSRNRSRNMDLHLVYGVVEIATGIPDWSGGLGACLAVSGAREDGVVAALAGFPIVGPEAPGIVSLFLTKLCRIPGGAAVG